MFLLPSASHSNRRTRVKEKDFRVKNGKKMIKFLCFFIICLVSVELNCKKFDRFGPNQKPVEPAYESMVFDKNADQRCFSLCHYELKCVALLIEKIADLQFQCSLYDKTIRYLTMTSNPDESVFYSQFSPIFRDCVDHYKAGERLSG